MGTLTTVSTVTGHYKLEVGLCETFGTTPGPCWTRNTRRLRCRHQIFKDLGYLRFCPNLHVCFRFKNLPRGSVTFCWIFSRSVGSIRVPLCSWTGFWACTHDSFPRKPHFWLDFVRFSWALLATVQFSVRFYRGARAPSWLREKGKGEDAAVTLVSGTGNNSYRVTDKDCVGKPQSPISWGLIFLLCKLVWICNFPSFYSLCCRRRIPPFRLDS